jgi:hypothetical protein
MENQRLGMVQSTISLQLLKDIQGLAISFTNECVRETYTQLWNRLLDCEPPNLGLTLVDTAVLSA